MGSFSDEILEKVKDSKGLASVLKINNYISNVEKFYSLNPFFYDKNQLFWLWNKKEFCYERTDEIDIMNLIDLELGFDGQTVTSGIRGNYLESFKRVGRRHIPSLPLKHWVQFKDKIIDVMSGEVIVASPNYWVVNSIPHELGKTGHTPVLDKLFCDWLGDDKNVLYEILSYCLLCDYPIHTIFAMVGSGRNGKSQFLKVVENFVGIDNITSASLDRITEERFESSKLYKKLVCMMGETNFTTLTKTEQLKKLCSGTDPIDFEFKNKNPFTGHNYAKIIINTNSLPASNDTTEGFYRRWMVINWVNTFPEGKDIIDSVPLSEYSELAFRCVSVLRDLLSKGSFSLQGSIAERQERYVMASNPISLFLQERCVQGDLFYIKAKDLYHAYISYLHERKRRIIKRKEFGQILAEEGFQAEHTDKWVDRNGERVSEKSNWVDGLKLKDFSNELVTNSFPRKSPLSPEILNLLPHVGNKVENLGLNRGNSGENLDVELKPKNSSKDILDFIDLQNILLDKLNHEIDINILEKLGFKIDDLNKWVSEGLIFRPKWDVIKLLE